MFDVTINDAKVFKSCVDSIVTLIDEGEFEVSDQGLSLRAMDPSQIAMVDFMLPKHAFEHFSATDSKLGVNMEDFARVMSRVRPEDKLNIKLDDSSSRLVLTFKGKSNRKFIVPLLDLGHTTPKQPQIDFEVEAKFNGSFLKEALKDTQLFSSHVVFNATEDAFIIEAQGDKGEVNIVIEKDNEAVLSYEVSKPARSMFPLEYLNDLLKSTTSTTIVELGLKTDAPLKLSYNIGDGIIAYYLAPRIETQ